MSKREYQRYPISFQEEMVARHEAGEKASRLAREYGFARKNVYRWTRKLKGRSRPRKAEPQSDPRDHRIQELQSKLTQLEAVIGRQWLEQDFFAGALRRIAEQRQKSGSCGVTASTPKSAPGRGRKAS